MSDSRRYFTLEEAKALLPKIREIVGVQMQRREEIEHEIGELSRALGSMPEVITVEESDSEAVATQKRRIASSARAWEEGWHAVEQLGVVVKDPRAGLLDFYGRVDGRVVFLCWKWNEPDIGFFHDLDAGFAGRKPIEGAVRTRMYN
jgi:hypothetical protein